MFAVPRKIIVITLVSAFLAVPAIAYAAKNPAAHSDLAGPAGYCWNYPTSAGDAVGKVQIATSPATTPGFHPVRVDIKIRAGQIPAGSYDVWLVNVYRNDAGEIIGCAASQLPNPLTARSGRPTDFRGSVDRYTGEYELQVYVGPIWGPGYGSLPAIVDVP